jgi:hypothetical protein
MTQPQRGATAALPWFARLRRRCRAWAPTLAAHSALTLLQQALNATAGILIVRYLDKPEYAIYVIAMAMLSATADLADAGAISTILRRGGEAANDDYAFARILRTGSRFRRQTTAIALVAVVPAMATVMTQAGAESSTVLLCCLLIILSSYFALASVLAQFALRIRYRFVAAGGIQASSAVLRVSLIAGAWAINAPLNAVVLMMFGAVLSLTEFSLASRFLQLQVNEDSLRRDGALIREFKNSARRQVPSSIFYVAQGQLLVLALASQGKASDLAEVAALGRFGILFGVLATLLLGIAVTTLSRAENLRVAVTRYAATAVLYLVVGTFVLGILIANDGFALAILGEGYIHLRSEFALICVGALVSSFGTVMVALNRARAWLRGTWVYIPITIFWTLGAVLVVGVSNTRDAATLACVLPFAGVAAHGYCTFAGVRDERKSSSKGIESSSLRS